MFMPEDKCGEFWCPAARTLGWQAINDDKGETVVDFVAATVNRMPGINAPPLPAMMTCLGPKCALWSPAVMWTESDGALVVERFALRELAATEALLKCAKQSVIGGFCGLRANVGVAT